MTDTPDQRPAHQHGSDPAAGRADAGGDVRPTRGAHAESGPAHAGASRDDSGDQPGVGPDDGGRGRPSGTAAVAAAEERAGSTRRLNIDDIAELPVPMDTANLRLGPELHPLCLSLLPLVGVWRGTGTYGNEPRTDESAPADFGQQIVVSHDGRPFLKFESIIWNLAGGDPSQAAREVGWLRPQPDGSIELLLAHAEGRLEVFYGQPRSVASWALSTDGVLRTPLAIPVVGATRLYGITPDGRLAYVEERAHTDAELAPHASALLERLAG